MQSDRVATRLSERASGWLSEHAPNHPALDRVQHSTGADRRDTPIVAADTESAEEDTVWLPTVTGPRHLRSMDSPDLDAHRPGYLRAEHRRVPTDPKVLSNNPAIRRRSATRYDHDLLRAIFTECASPTFASLPVSLATALLEAQFRAHRMDRQQRWPDAVDQIIEVHGVPAGRLTMSTAGHLLRVLDFGLLTGFRGQGIGRAVFTDLIDEAVSHEMCLRGVLAKDSRTLALYLSCGLQVVAESDTHFELERAC
jgi:GNAT superfamily N-acetyltransferase